MTARTTPTRYAFEYPDEAGYPDGKGTLSQDQIVLIDELLDDPHTPAFAIEVPTMTFARSLVNSADAVLHECRQRGWITAESQSLRRLNDAVRELSD